MASKLSYSRPKFAALARRFVASPFNLCRPPSPDSCSSMPRPDPARRRCARRSSGSGRRIRGARSLRLVEALACGFAASRAEARPAPRRHRREPAAPVRLDARGAVARRDPGAALPGRRRRRVRLPDRQCRGRRSRSSRTRSRSTSCSRSRDRCPHADADLVRRPARPAQLPRAGPRLARRARREPGAHTRRRTRTSSRARSRGAAGRRRGDVLHLGDDRQRQGRRPHATTR